MKQIASIAKIGIIGLLIAAFLVSPLYASSEVLQTTCDVMLRFWSWLQTVVYLLAAIALAIMSFQASIMGKFQMGNLVSWGGALFIMAMTPLVIAFLTGGSITLNCSM